MDAVLIAGVELVLEKEASAKAGAGMLARAVTAQATRYGLNKRAGEVHAVVVEKAGPSGPPSSASSNPHLKFRRSGVKEWATTLRICA